MPGAVPCWHHVQVNCQIVRDTVLAVVMRHCGRVPEFRRAPVDAAWAELEGAPTWAATSRRRCASWRRPRSPSAT
jgi:hypothetical protein